MLKPASTLLALAALCTPLLRSQESTSGFSMPVTISAGAMYTQRLQLADPNDSAGSAGLRFMLYPTLQFGPHWFAYAAAQIRLSPYFYYDAYDADHEWYSDLIQAYIGYSQRWEKTSLVIKAGRLSSAFGSFPLRYDDAQNPLLDQPLSYIQTLTLRADGLPCGVKSLVMQGYGYAFNSCGGVGGPSEGLTPVTLYGLPGIEAELSSHRLDARLQITSGSPGSPQGWDRAGQYAQWTAGGGYTIRQGIRVGISGFRGPYLDPSVAALLPVGTGVRSFPASGLGIDAQWAHGRFSATAEWQRFWYDSPNFTVAPSVQSTYGEVKAVLTPRLFVAGRAGWLNSGGARDNQGVSVSQFAPNLASYELGAGFWLNRHQLVKTSYEWLDIQGFPGNRLNVLGVQLVTSFRPIDWAFH